MCGVSVFIHRHALNAEAYAPAQKTTHALLTVNFLYAKIEAKKPCKGRKTMLKSRIQAENGAPRLYIEEKEISAMAYTTYFGERNRYEDFIAAGYRIFFVNASFTSLPINSAMTGFTPFRIGVFENGKEDYSEFEAGVEEILSLCPDAIIFPRLYVSMPTDWIASHPEETVMTAKGGQREMLFSEVFREDGKALLSRFVSHVKSAPYAHRIGGWQICGGLTQEWFHHNAEGSLCENAKKYYDLYHEAHYGCRAVSVPSMEDYRYQGAAENTNENARRYAEFSSVAVAETVEQFAKTIKDATGGTQIVGAFYGYAYEGPYDSVLSGSYALRKLLSSEYLDFFSSPNAYVGGRSFGMDWADMIPVDSVKAHEKLAFIECDIRTYLTIAIQDCRPGEYPDDMYRADDGSSLWVGPPTVHLSLLALRKCFAHQIARRSAVWWFDMWGGWFADPTLMQALVQMKKIYDAQVENDCAIGAPEAEVAFIADEQAYASLFSRSPQMRGAVQTRTALGKTGVPFDSIMAEDAEALLPRYKAAIFPFSVPSEAGKKAIALCESLGIPYLIASPERASLSLKELRDFLEKSGVHICGDTQNVVYLGNGYIGLHSAEGGKKTLRLPRPMRVTAVYGTEFSETVTDRIEFDLEENGTALFALR